jgi:hypothetical protein
VSHFSVLVVTQSPDEEELTSLLQPYHEFECTGIDDQYVQDIDLTEEALAQFADFDRNDDEFIFRVESYYGFPVKGDCSEEDEAYGYITLDEDGKLKSVVRRTNPNRKWDWWQVGGRWSGLLLTRLGEKVDQAQKINIDFDLMVAKNISRQVQKYEMVQECLATQVEPFMTWEETRKLYPGDIDKAQEVYNRQPAMIALRAKNEERGCFDFLFNGFEEMSKQTLSDCIDQAKREALLTFAYLDTNGWQQRGQMGWFSVFSDKNDDWNFHLKKLIEEIPDDHYLTIVDCHI